MILGMGDGKGATLSTLEAQDTMASPARQYSTAWIWAGQERDEDNAFALFLLLYLHVTEKQREHSRSGAKEAGRLSWE